MNKMTYSRAIALLKTRAKRDAVVCDGQEEKRLLVELWNDEINAYELAIQVLTEKERKSERFRKVRK